VPGSNGVRSEPGYPLRALFLVEYALGHRTHAQFLDQHLNADPRYDAQLIRLSRPGIIADLLTRLQIPPLHRRGLDFWIWWLMQYKRAQVRRLLRHRDPNDLDLIYFHTQTAAAALLDMPKTIPAVVSIDLTWKLVFRESRYLQSPAFEPAYRLEHRIFDRSDLIVSFSDWAAASVIEDYGIPASKVVVVRNGITLPGQQISGNGVPTNGAAHREANGTGPLRLGFIGNGFERKGGDLLLRVHQERFADLAHLTLVTKDPPKANGYRNVSVHSDVPWDDLMTRVLPAFDLFVFPARFDYSPYAVIEAMSAGVPVVATRVGAIPEMVKDGVNGFLLESCREAPLVDRMEWAISNRSHLPAMGDQARQHAAGSYAAAQNYPRLLDLLAAVAR